jgi:hypothetical protein
LLSDLGRCEVEIETSLGVKTWVSASVVREVSIDLAPDVRIPIDAMVDGEDAGVSRYPNEIRYGESYTDFDPAFVTTAALLLAEWAKEHWRSIRLTP